MPMNQHFVLKQLILAPAPYLILIIQNKAKGLHKIINVKKDMRVELCNNYVIFDGLVNGADGFNKII
jgi:hypothetical protein